MLQISTQCISEKLSDVFCAATGATQTNAAAEGAIPSIYLTFPKTADGLEPIILIEAGGALEDKAVQSFLLNITLKTLDIFPLLQCILVLLRERKPITSQLEENILSALHEAILNALIHGNLNQHSRYNDSYKMFDHFEAIGQMLLTSKTQEILKMQIEFLSEHIVISITDNGKGFSEDAIVPPGESALHGRGMAIIRECADTVDISNHGCTITMRFACGQQQANIQNKIENSHILIVEDVAVNRAIITQMLKAKGFKHLSFAIDGIEAYEKTLELKPDLVLLDLVLPRMDGYEYCHKIRQHPDFQNLPIVVQTILSQPEERSKAFACGASDLVTKPINAYELTARISLLLEKQALMKDMGEYQQRIQSELSTARAMQHSIMPNPQTLKNLEARYGIKAHSLFQPSSEIGGDLWGIRMISEAECAFYSVDFSGHGITAALNAFRFQAMLQSMMVDMTDPAAVLTRLNEKLHELLTRGQFATMFYAVLNTLSDTLQYAAAGSTAPALLRGGESVEWLDSRGLPLGASLAATFVNHSVQMEQGDALLLYSDALIETPNAEGDCLSAETIEASVKTQDHALAFNKILAEFKKQNMADDDLTIVLLSRSA